MSKNSTPRWSVTPYSSSNYYRWTSQTYSCISSPFSKQSLLGLTSDVWSRSYRKSIPFQLWEKREVVGSQMCMVEWLTDPEWCDKKKKKEYCTKRKEWAVEIFKMAECFSDRTRILVCIDLWSVISNTVWRTSPQ